jgi:hypothetical protein
MMDGVGSMAVAGWSLESGQMRLLDGQAKAMRGLNNDLHSFQARALENMLGDDQKIP